MRYHRNKRSTSLSSCGLLRCNNEARICDTVPRGMCLVLTNTHIPGDTTETTSSSSPPQSQWTAIGYSLLSALYTEKLNTQRTFLVLQNFPNWWLILATLVELIIQWDSRIVSTSNTNQLSYLLLHLKCMLASCLFAWEDVSPTLGLAASPAASNNWDLNSPQFRSLEIACLEK